MVEEILAYSTMIVAFATLGALGIHWYYYRKQNDISKNQVYYSSMIEIMKIFNNEKNAYDRHVIYTANRENQLYDAEDEIKNKFVYDGKIVTLNHIVASVSATYDQMGKLINENYVRQEEFLDMYVGSVIRMGKILRLHILHQRKIRNTDHFMIYFEQIFSDGRVYWEKKFPSFPEPEPF